MPAEFAFPSNQETIIRRSPVATYFALTFVISWTAALAVAASYLIRHQLLPKITGILMFPVMLIGPSVAGIALTRIVDGKRGLRVLLSQMFRARAPPRWYMALLLPPALVLTVLLFLERFVSPVYTPNRYFMGILLWDSGWFLRRNWLDGLVALSPEKALKEGMFAVLFDHAPLASEIIQ